MLGIGRFKTKYLEPDVRTWRDVRLALHRQGDFCSSEAVNVALLWLCFNITISCPDVSSIGG